MRRPCRLRLRSRCRRSRWRRDRARLAPLVAALFAESDQPTVVAERIEVLPGLTAEDQRLAWDLVLERACAVPSVVSR